MFAMINKFYLNSTMELQALPAEEKQGFHVVLKNQMKHYWELYGKCRL